MKTLFSYTVKLTWAVNSSLNERAIRKLLNGNDLLPRKNILKCIGLDFLERKFLNFLKFPVTRETDTKTKLNNLEKLQFLNDKNDQNTKIAKCEMFFCITVIFIIQILQNFSAFFGVSYSGERKFDRIAGISFPENPGRRHVMVMQCQETFSAILELYFSLHFTCFIKKYLFVILLVWS